MMADANTTAAQGAPTATKRGFRRKLVGKVTSDRMNKTVVVEVVRTHVAKKYRKYVKARETYKAHDETNEYGIGDTVEIQEHRPISKHKRWVVTKLVRASAERRAREASK
jgi:small subunit ribosomal protein S17